MVPSSSRHPVQVAWTGFWEEGDRVLSSSLVSIDDQDDDDEVARYALEARGRRMHIRVSDKALAYTYVVVVTLFHLASSS